MSWWDDLTHPINDALNSSVFKAMFPVQALAQGLTQKVSGLTGMNHGQGLNPADQYAAGAAGGTSLAGGSALMGGSGAGSMTPYMPGSAPNMGMAGSTMGGGMGSPLNLAPSYGSATGASATGMPAAAAGPSSISQVLQTMRGSPMGGQQQAQPQGDVLQKLYEMFPGLKPGGHMGMTRMGGM